MVALLDEGLSGGGYDVEEVPELGLGEFSALGHAVSDLGGEQFGEEIVFDLDRGWGTVTSPVVEQTPPSSYLCFKGRRTNLLCWLLSSKVLD